MASIEVYNQLRALQQKHHAHLEENCNDKADLYKNLGNHFYFANDKNQALKYYQDTALQISLECPSIDHELITQIYLNILNSKIVLDQKQTLPSVIDSLKAHLKKDQAGSITHQALIQSEISRYYSEIGDYDQAMLWIRKSVANHNKLPLSEYKLRAHLAWAYILYSLEDYQEAILMFDTTMHLAQRLGLKNDSDYNESLIYNIAVCYEELGNFKQALQYNELYASMTDPKDLIVRSDIANLKAYVAFGEKEYDQSLMDMNESIQLSIESKDEYQISGLITDFLFISKAHLNLQNYHAAAHAALQAMERSIVVDNKWKDQLFDFSQLFVKNPNGFNKAAFGFFKAIVHYESEKNIVSYADQLDSTFFSLQTYYSGDESKSEITRRHHEFCDQFLGYIFENGLQDKYPDLASYYISTSKSLSLLEKLSEKNGIPDALKAEYNALNEAWNETYSALETQASLGNNVKMDSLAEVNFQLNLRRENLDKQLASQDLVPNFRNLRSNLIAEAVAALQSEEVIADFFYGDERIYSWSMNHDGIKFASDTIHPLLAADFVSTFSSTETQQLQAYDASVASLTRYFEPFFEHVDSDINKLTLIPDGKLLYFPFEALPLNDQLLIEQASIHYQFSYSISAFQRNEDQQQRHPYAGFAMEYDEAFLKQVSESEKINKIFKTNFDLTQLPYAVEEVKLANEIFAGNAYLDEACTQEVFFEAADGCQILHIANHALLNEHNSFLSSVLFSKRSEADLVNALDIKKLNLTADLAILSSCNSGRGENIAGSGLRSLGLSFAEAGCPAILVNLWEAADKSTRHIIEVFARNVKQGQPKSEALQKAKLDYIQSVPRELQHPKYWAGLVLIGDDTPIDMVGANNNNWLFYLAGVILLLFIASKFRK